MGNRFKWAELIKTIDYEQDRDGQAVSQASERTRGIYGDYSKGGASLTGGMGDTEKTIAVNAGELHEPTQKVEANGSDAERTGDAAYGNGTEADESSQTLPKDADMDNDTDSYVDWRDHAGGYVPGIEISDDIDDEAILGRNRRRQKQARTNTR